jgi:hypothetical protein
VAAAEEAEGEAGLPTITWETDLRARLRERFAPWAMRRRLRAWSAIWGSRVAVYVDCCSGEDATGVGIGGGIGIGLYPFCISPAINPLPNPKIRSDIATSRLHFVGVPAELAG